MRKVLVTGMSGTGKSTALRELGARGHRVVDTDTDDWSRWITLPDGSTDWVWRETEMTELLDGHRDGALFVSGCKTNQGAFYPLFDEVVLLSAPAEVMLDRIARRDSNPYGKDAADRAAILHDLETVEPLLRRTATVEIDATTPVADVVGRLEALGLDQGRPAVVPARGTIGWRPMATHWTLGCDAADPHRLAAFWALALGYVDEPGYDDPDGASIIDPDGKGPAIGFLHVPEGKTAKNKVHIDVRVAGEPPWDMAEREQMIRAKAAELVAAGARTVREESYGERLGHVVMLDPEGNEFCVA